jgi:hypothetical protein
MGRVFTWEDVAHNRIPSRDDFFKTVSRTRRILGGNCPGVLAGVICGSVLRGDCTERSDIDCLVIYDSRCAWDVMAELRALSGEAAMLHVPLEIIPLATDVAATRLHHIEPFFAHHLELAVRSGGMFRANPMPYINLEGFEMGADYRSYLTEKIHMFETGLPRLQSVSEEMRCRLYQKALEAPVHIARKALAMQGDQSADDSKRAVCERYRLVARSDELGMFERLLELDLAYSKALVTAGQQPREDYLRVLGRLDEAVWLSFQFVRLLLLREAGAARP